MTDIVERLRECDAFTESMGNLENAELLRDAADEIEAWKNNNKAGWAALGLIREALTEWCIPGTLPSMEYADGPTQQHEAEQLIAAISALRADRDRLRDAIKAAHFLLAWRYQEWIACDALPERGFWLATDLRTEARNMMDAGEQELFDALKEPHVLAALSDTENPRG